jgi:cytochrome c oxidase subunit 4
MSEYMVRTNVYYRVFAALIALTILTVGASFLELGQWHTTVGVAIGVAKACLVALFFMGLRHGAKTSWLAVLAGLFWLAILMLLTLSDYLTRTTLSFY